MFPPGERERVRRAALAFPLAVTPYYLSLIDPADPDDPIRKMVVPNGLELEQDRKSVV